MTGPRPGAGAGPGSPAGSWLAAALVVLILSACGPAPRAGSGEEGAADTATREDTMGGDRVPGRSIAEVVAAHRDAWMDRPEVTGVGIGRCEGTPCIVLYLLRRTDELEASLPDSVEGHPVRLEVTGRVEPRRPPDGEGEEGG